MQTELSQPEQICNGAERAQRPRNKQAVVVIHGMGEQRPMATLRSFVDTAWVRNPSIRASRHTPEKGNPIWVVPDSRLTSYEQRRITTSHHDGVRTDFFEVYWADVMGGTTVQHLWAWLRGLLFRWPKDVPDDVFSAWMALWVLISVAVVLFLWSVSGDLGRADPPKSAEQVRWTAGLLLALLAVLASAALDWRARQKGAGPGSRAMALLWPAALAVLIFAFGPLAWLTSPKAWAFAGAALIGVVIHNVVVPTFGDVARYVRAAPDTIEKRQAVRERGLDLLDRLHKEDYRRIILVGHSLGSVIAYDILMLLWARRGPTQRNPPSASSVAALGAIDPFLARGAFERHGALNEFRGAQRRVFEALRTEAKEPWLISDFVTLGSPLTHAEFLVARNQKAFESAVSERAVATCPPQPDDVELPAPSILYEVPGTGRLYPHHAAPFAAVRWTNIYDPAEYILRGDIVSGPLRDHFGAGVKDCEVRIGRRFLFWKDSRFFTHTSYWDQEAFSGGGKSHLDCLWAALALGEH